MRFLLAVLFAAACAPLPPAPQGGSASERPALAGAPLKIALERPPPGTGAEPAPVLVAAQAELSRQMDGLRAKGDPPPYFMAVTVNDTSYATVSASFGALAASDISRRRTADVEARVGDYALDNTHPLRGDGFSSGAGLDRYVSVPLDDDPVAVRAALWRAADAAHKKAVERYLKVKAERQVKVKEEDASDDFSREKAARYVEPPHAFSIDRALWERRIEALSAEFREHPFVHDSLVQLDLAASTRFFANSEGGLLQTARVHARISVHGRTRSDDGMELFRIETADAVSIDRLPGDGEVRARIARVVKDLSELRQAPLADAYAGPAILDGKAAAVFFHEIFGHRVEGHRQKREEEGQTFARKIGERVMPEFISVFDDPAVQSLDRVDLNGFYRFDDEGVLATRASLVDDGVLKGFLMSRSPARGFNRSNGHGRRQEGYAVVARQGNLIVQPRAAISPDALKTQLIAEVKKQGKPYGLRLSEVTGGFTNTERWGFQAFKVMPVMVYRIWPDGREELVRGADIEGTPLTTLSKILAAADDTSVFNGYCGAESGTIPVSAASPSLLVAQLEIVRKPKGQERPPILPPPPMQAAARSP